MRPIQHLVQGLLLVLVCASPLLLAQGEWEGTAQEEFLEGPIVRKYQCTTCHTVTETGGTVGPILNHVGLRRSEDWLRRWLSDPQDVKPGTKMPKFDFTPGEFSATLASLTAMTTTVDSRALLSRPGSPAEKGERLFRAYDCLACHRLGREGRFTGPDLTWLGLRKTRAWERVWLHDPAAFKPDTFMPNFDLGDDEVEALTAYLETLRGQSNGDSQEWEFMINLYLNNKAPRRGEALFKRFACWACHGEVGQGGIRNPNAAPDETMPALTTARTFEELQASLSARQVPEPLDPAEAPPPFSCPDYSGAIAEDEMEDLFAYLETIAPKKSKWKIR